MPGAIESYVIDTVDLGEVLHYLGYSGQKLDGELSARIDEVVARCLAVGRPRGVTRVFDVEGTSEEGGVPVLRLSGTSLELAGYSIASHLDGAVAVGVLAVTAGMGVEAELRRLSLTDRVAQVILDAAGSALVERAADAAEASLVAQAADRGLYCGKRFSPGYGDLPLETQPVLLTTLDAGRLLGITLSDSLLMSPTKSVTAVVGFFECPPADARPGCSACYAREFCLLRRSGRTCRG